MKVRYPYDGSRNLTRTYILTSDLASRPIISSFCSSLYLWVTVNVILRVESVLYSTSAAYLLQRTGFVVFKTRYIRVLNVCQYSSKACWTIILYKNSRNRFLFSLSNSLIQTLKSKGIHVATPLLLKILINRSCSLQIIRKINKMIRSLKMSHEMNNGSIIQGSLKRSFEQSHQRVLIWKSSFCFCWHK